MIELSGLEHRILNIKSLSIPPGHTCIIGENGSGKSTLLRLLSGIELPCRGEIYSDKIRIRNRNTGYVPEFPDRNIIFEDVYDEIASPLRFAWEDDEKIKRSIEEITNLLDISHLLKKNTGCLSGGEKAFVSLAVALISKPEILILDEPDSHLDFATAERFNSLLKSREIRYAIHCTQDMNLAKNADFLIFMEKGRPKYTGKPDLVFEKLQNTPFLPVSWRLKGFV